MVIVARVIMGLGKVKGPGITKSDLDSKCYILALADPGGFREPSSNHTPHAPSITFPNPWSEIPQLEL